MYNTIENSPSSLSIILFSSIQATSNLVQRHVVWFYRSYQTLEQIDHYLHNDAFDGVICKPPIGQVKQHFRVKFTYRKIKLKYRFKDRLKKKRIPKIKFCLL